MMTEEQKQALIARCNYLIGGAPEIDVQLAEFALAALTQTEKFRDDIKHDALCDTNYARGVAHGWNLAQNSDREGMMKCIESRTTEAMSAFAKAPHTAQIEPICATGGAEWVNPVPSELQQVLLELRTYSPKADEHGGKYIIPGWADRIEKALGIKPVEPEEK